MRHRKRKNNLNKFTSWRRATLISLSRNLLINQSIRTTRIKAKAAKPLVDRLIALGKRNDLTSRRTAFSILQDHQLVKQLFSEIAPQFNNQAGGFCRVLPMGFRRGDGAAMAILELTKKIEKKKKVPKAEKAQEKPKEEISQPAVKPKKPPRAEKPKRKFIGGLRKIFKKERDSL